MVSLDMSVHSFCLLSDLLNNIAEMVQPVHAVDLIDRPEWRPPSNSPYKSVGPPALGSLLDSPSSKVASKPKTVKFFNTPKEHDIGNESCIIISVHKS